MKPAQITPSGPSDSSYRSTPFPHTCDQSCKPPQSPMPPLADRPDVVVKVVNTVWALRQYREGRR